MAYQNEPPEKGQELAYLKAKHEHVYNLEHEIIGKFLKADKPEEAQEAIYEYVLKDLMAYTIQAQIDRLEGNVDASGARDGMDGMQEELDSINNGHWGQAKQNFWDYGLCGWDASLIPNPANYRRWGIEQPIVFEGTTLLVPDEIEHTQRFEHSDILDKFYDYLETKYLMCPDETPPYRNPNVEDFKAKLADY